MSASLSAADRLLHEAVLSLDGALMRLDDMLGRVAMLPAERVQALLSSRFAPDMFTFAQQVRSAVDFALRMAMPLCGREVPVPPSASNDLSELHDRIAAARAALDLPESAFAGAAERQLSERAGFADLELDASDFVLRFGLPNFWFHLTTAYALMRAAGVAVGKADIDGLHDYPPGFSF
ncbi:DUF1993 domain-containing protein [Cereibacter sphaeroides]|nr:DUF1993 domain-containing protein [Cereibacter sphaeroides]